MRVFRAAHELSLRTVAIYSHEDRLMQHRSMADEAYEVSGPGIMETGHRCDSRIFASAVVMVSFLSLHSYKYNPHLIPLHVLSVSGVTPVGAYLDIARIVDIAKRMGVSAIHPGYCLYIYMGWGKVSEE